MRMSFVRWQHLTEKDFLYYLKYLYVNEIFVRRLKRLGHYGRPTEWRWRPPGQFLQVSLSGFVTRFNFEIRSDEMEWTPNVKCQVNLLRSKYNSRHAGIDRNKRCLLAYLNSRMEKMREMRWQFGAVLPEEIKLNLSEPELEYFSKYNRNLATYMRAIGTDLTSDMDPPKSLYVEVRVMEDHGEVETADGEVVLLKAGSQHHLPR